MEDTLQKKIVSLRDKHHAGSFEAIVSQVISRNVTSHEFGHVIHVLFDAILESEGGFRKIIPPLKDNSQLLFRNSYGRENNSTHLFVDPTPFLVLYRHSTCQH